MSQCAACNVGGAALQTPNSVTTFESHYRDIFVPLTADDGTYNEIDLSVTVDQAYIDARVNDTDESKRWVFAPRSEQYESPRADTESETSNRGTIFRGRQGNKEISYELWGTDSYFLAQMEKLKCRKGMGLFRVDKCGKLQGDRSVVGFLRPVPLEDNSLDIILMDAQDPSTTIKNMVKYQFGVNFRDSSLGVVLCEDMGSDVNLVNQTDLVPLVSVGTGSATGSNQTVVIPIQAPYSTSVGGGQFFPGLAAADFEMDGGSGGDGAIPDTATEDEANKSYVLVFPVATFSASDVLTVKVIATGVEDTQVQSNTITAVA